MNEHTLKVLDYFTILEKAKSYTLSEEGKESILALRPLISRDLIEDSLKETAEAMSFLEKNSHPLNGIKSISESVDALSHGVILNPYQLWNIANNLKIITKTKDIIKDKEYSTLQRILQPLGDFNEYIGLIDRSISDDGSILDTASSELEVIRKKIAILKNRLRKELEEIVSQNSLRPYLQGDYITERKGRWVIPVKSEHKSNFPGIVHDTSSSGSTIFMEPLKTIQLSNDITSWERKEEHEINRILKELSDNLRKIFPSLKESLEISIHLETVFAKASFGFGLNCVIPELSEIQKIEIIGGRHPLLTVKPVPVDIEIGTSYKTLIISGPNTGGKTVSLKIAGLFILMAQSGFPVPAYKVNTGIFPKIFADIGDEQSIAQNISTFSSHMGNISSFLPDIDSSTLVILDELGAGTDPQEGSALAYALLEHLHKHSAIVLISTHHSELKTFPYRHSQSANGSMEFDLASLKPTYKLIIGVPGRSFALLIAKKLGIPGDVVKNAGSLMPQTQKELSELVKNLEEIRKNYESRKTEYETLLNDTQKIKENYEKELKELKSKRRKILSELRTEGEEKIDELLTSLKELMKKIEDKKSTIKDARSAYQDLKLKADDTISNFIEKTIEQPEPLTLLTPTKLSPGDRVYIDSLQEEGIVIKSVDKKGFVLVQAGFLKTAVPIESIKVVDERISQPVKKVPEKSLFKEFNENIPLRLDLHGIRGEEAINLLDQYVEQAYLAGYREVRIVHGIGKGILKKLVRDFLYHHPYIDKVGTDLQEGEGVTLLIFKE